MKKTKCLILILTFVGLLFSNILTAQGIDDLGVVWTKTYGNGAINNIKSNPDGTYTACGRLWNNSTPKGVDCLDGLIIEYDETGNEIRRAVVRIPSSYITGHTVTRATAYFNIAFKTDDGGFLAFGTLFNYDAPVGEKQPNWNGDVLGSKFLTNGTWIVKLDANLNVKRNELVRGMGPRDAWRTSNGNFVVGGFDVNTVGSDSITMLRKYNQAGDLVTDSRQNYREINAIYKFPTNNNFIAITPDRLLKIDANLHVTATLIKTVLSEISAVVIPFGTSISPSIDNGIFISTHLKSNTHFPTNWDNGNGIFKIASDNSVPFLKITKPADTIFFAPMLLPGNDVPPRYVGVARVSDRDFANSKYYIYELTDNGDKFTYRIGNEYPNGSELKAVSISDGFFSCGQNSAGEAVIAKLSTCAKFIPNVGRTNENILPGQSFSGRTVSHVGNKGTVSYSWTLTDITPGGNAIDGWAGITKIGTNNILPAQQFNLAPGKTHALLQYSITALDSYESNSVPQKCQQTHTILVKVQAMPDNITDADCVLGVVGTNFDINKLNTTVGGKVLHAYCAPVAGDLDGNKIPDVVALGHLDDEFAKNVYIYFDTDRANPKVITTEDVYSRNIGGVAIARVEIGVDTVSLIVVHGTDQYLYAYNANGAINQAPVWTSSSVTGVKYAAIGFADFNNDGIPEVYAGKKIYNAVTGKELLASPGNFGVSVAVHSLVAVADVYGDSKLEYIAGNQVYEVNIVNKNDNTSAENTMTLVKEITGAEYTDGVTVVADINRDGKLDVAVRVTASPSRLYIWDVDKEQIIAQTTYANSGVWNSVPFVGDIDGDGDLEIIVVTTNKLNVFDYNGTTTLAARTPITIIDASGCTGITLFDFNQDGTAELVYRDEYNLYIYNIVGSTLVAKETIPCGSRTVFEYPIVVDVDGDGSAEIVVIGGEASAVSGHLHILKSKTPGTWGPARHVWNQYAYNVVNVNDDLTIPRYQLNPATFFPGRDGVPGGIDDIQPFNNFLQQQTTLDKNGVPVFLAPEAQLASTPVFNYLAAADSMLITVQVSNTGNASLQNPLKISVHKNQIPGDKVFTYEYKQTIGVGDTDTITFGIGKFKTQWAINPFNNIVIQINDNGNGYNDQPVCDSLSRDFKSGKVIASDDRVLLFKNSSNNQITVTLNDIKSCIDPKVTIVTPPKHALSCTVVNDSVIQYSPATDYIGNDTLRYKVACGTDSYEATVYIAVIEKPDNISDANCFIKPEVKTFAIKEHISFGNVNSMSTPLVANLLGNGPEIIVPKMSNPGAPWLSKGLVIANVKDNTSREISTVAFATHGQSVVIADVDKDGKCEIFIQNVSGGAIHCYNPDGTAKSGFGTGGATVSTDAHYIIQLADLNNDGNAELIAGPYIFDAKTGVLRMKMTFEADGKGYGNPHSLYLNPNPSLFDGYYFMPAIGDVDGDGLLEIVGSTTVYKPNAALNAYTKTTVDKASAPAAFKKYWDGPTVLVDFDLDGQLDVCVIGHEYAGGIKVSDYQLYVWSPKTRKITAYSPAVIRTSSGGNHGNPTVPYVGDLDNNGYPDIAFASTEPAIGMTTFQYDNTQPGNIKPGPIEPKFAETAGFTMFDFNQDGKAEIVYRGTSFFYIVDLNDAKNAYVELSPRIQAWSGTIAEYPIVADVDGDGQAEIILTRALAPWSSGDATGVVSVYKTGDATKPWAPARSVWNQWNYNSVNINDDMTIPKFQINPATVFPGEDGQLGTSDDIRPYNGFLLQQTILNKFGTPLWLAPNVAIATPAPTYSYHAMGDSMVITLTINNTGDASLQKDVYITIYKDVVNASSAKYTYAHPEGVAKGSSKVVTFAIPNFSTWIKPANNNTKLIVKINDKGEAKDHQPVCETANTTHSKLYSNLLLANNDYTFTLENNPVTIDVLGNDSIPTGCTPLISIVSQPANGTATLNSTNDSVIYTPNAGYVGHDTLSYQIKCNNDISIANVMLMVYKKPDNIVDPGSCNILMPSFDFKIKQQWQTINAGYANTGPLVGDLDGDGLPEIIAYSPDLTAVNIYNGQSGVFISQIKFPAPSSFAATGGWMPHMTSILVDADKNGKAEIIGVDPATRHIYSYEVGNTGGVFSLTLKWKAPLQFQNPFTKDNLPHLNVADFNGDGVPELLIYNQIYNAATGAFLGETEPMAAAHKGCDPGRVANAWNQSSNFQTTADFDGDGYPEIVAGGKVYKVNFNAAKTAVSCSVLKSNAGVPDGFTAVADIDMDGNLDVVVASTSGNIVSLYVWSPLTAWMTKKEIYTSINNYPAHSFPFVGDIDGAVNGVTGKRHPEICIVTAKPNSTTGGRVFAYKYNTTTKALDVKWTLDNSDQSGGTGITLFDFNNDGINELVYRDQTHLRILNGATDGVTPGLADPGAIFACASGTALEYPVIADTDGDGSANICVTCSAGYGIAPHYLRVYESASQPWAPTRKVWNQVNYEPLQINENLTVPKMSIPKNMEFKGKHPYNGALIQIPIVDENFKTVILAPDPATAGMKLEAINATTLRVWFEIENKGQRFINVNLPITLYHTDTIAANILGTKSIGVSLEPGAKVKLYWDISSSFRYTKFIVRIQDDGVKYPADGSYLDCDYTNNLDSINVLLAFGGFCNTDKNTSLVIDVLANDLHGSCGRNALTVFDTIKNSGLHMGSLTISGDSVFTYTPQANKTGVDSVDYYIKCAADSSAARTYILTNSPLSRQYVACPGAVVTMGFKAITGVQYNWYDAETGGTIVTGGTNVNTLTITKGDVANDISIWWVEPVWKGIKFTRYKIVLAESLYCGNLDATGCTKDGTLLYREDFGGNNVGDPRVSATMLAPGLSDLNFCATGSGTCGAFGYCFEKYSTYPTFVTNCKGGDDNTSFGDTTRGYYMYIDPAPSQMNYKLYGSVIKDLCPGTNLSFSLWAADFHSAKANTHAQPKIEMLILDARTKDTIVTTGVFTLYREISYQIFKYRQYGLDFVLPSNTDSILFYIINKEIDNFGNDWALDDIEIRICTPPINLSVGLDTSICMGTKLDIISVYDEDCTFGDDLTYRWEFKAKNTNNWVNLIQDNVTLDCNGVSPTNRLTKTWTINSAEYTHEGYYRMLVSAKGNIDRLNCRASSDSVYVRTLGTGALPDIRVQFCPDTGTKLYLSSYIDTATYNFGGWSKVTVGSPNLISAVTGELNAADFFGTNIYKYVLKNQCGNYEGKLYLKTLTNTILGLSPDTVAVCRELESSSHLHLNQIMGIGVNGDWKYDNTVNPDNTVWDNVTKIVAPHVNAGAYIFNASKAWDDAVGIAAYLVPGGYRGDMTAKMFKIRYTTAALSCVGTVVKETVIVVTDILVP